MDYIPHKIPKYLSPSSLDLWETNKQEFFLKYLAYDRPPRIPQNQAMSVGSAFDAYVKDALARDLGILTPDLEFEYLFEQNVEPQNRDFAREAGMVCFRAYSHSEVYHDRLRLMTKADNIRLDHRKKATVVDGVPLSGVPDIEYTLHGARWVDDLKARGYMGKSSTSPTQGYILCRDGFSDGAPSRNNYEQHKKVSIGFLGDVEFDENETLESCNKQWATQLATYHWMTGTPVGGEMYVGIDELCCGGPNGYRIRVAQHRTTISSHFQRQRFAAYLDLWAILNSDHVFRDMTKEESQERCTMMMKQALAYDGETVEDEWYRSMMNNARS